MRTPDIQSLKNRIIETGEIDSRNLLRPLLLFKGAMTEGRARSLWNLLVTMMDAEISSVTEGVKIATAEDYRHFCGLHSNPLNLTFGSIISRVVQCRETAGLVPGLWEYARHLGNSSGGHCFTLDPISPFSDRVSESRKWRRSPQQPRAPRQKKITAPKLPELYPYISGTPTSEHEMLLAVDAIVPKSLPYSMRGDVCQDMIVAVLSGEVSLENLKGDLRKYMVQFWKMFPAKYGNLSLDAVLPGTDSLKLMDLITTEHVHF